MLRHSDFEKNQITLRMYTAVPVGSASTNTLVTALVYIDRTCYPVWLAVKSDLYNGFMLSSGKFHDFVLIAFEIAAVYL